MSSHYTWQKAGNRSIAFAHPAHMKDLYDRLKDAGFDPPFVRAHLLPDWWDDSLANVPASRAMAEASISRMLGFLVRDLRNPAKKLRPPPVANVRLKRRKDSPAKQIAPAILLAQRIAATIVQSLAGIPAFTGQQDADTVRQQILQQRQFVDLESLLDFAWSSGIVVFHLGELPRASKKFTGMALFCDQTPVIVLASGRDSPPWLAFHLVHELAHIMCGHVAEGTPPLADGDIDQVGKDAEETEADEFACQVFIRERQPSVPAVYGMTAPKLVEDARRVAARMQIDPGAVALIYGRSAQRMGVAQNALKLLGLDRGAHQVIASALESRLADDLPESVERFLSLVTGG